MGVTREQRNASVRIVTAVLIFYHVIDKLSQVELLGCVSESVLESSAWESAGALSEPCFPGPFPHP